MPARLPAGDVTAPRADWGFAVTLAGVVLVALAIRLLCWVGPGARDDAQYMAYALDWVHGHYGFLGVDSVFAARPAVYAPVALTARFFAGRWPDSAAGFFLVMSLVHVVAVGGIGWRLGSREGVLAALLIAVFPLDVAFASQVMPDLPMAAWLAVGVWMLSWRGRLRWTWLAGVAFGLAAATKEFAVVALVLVPPLLPWAEGWRRSAQAAVLVALGFAFPFAFEVAWFSAHGDPQAVLAAILHNARAEKNGNPDGYYLFKMLLETLPPAYGTRWFGALGWAWVVSLFVMARHAIATPTPATARAVRQAAFFVFWAVAYFVFLQYVGPVLAGRTTIERMERFLIPMGAPMALGVAAAFGVLSRSRTGGVRAAAWTGVTCLVLAMLRATVIYAFPNEVVLASDWRAITHYLETAGIRSVLMDRDAAFRVTVFSAGRVVGRVLSEDHALNDVPPDEWVVVSANPTDHLRRAGQRIPAPWREAARVPGPILGPLATFDPVVYWTGPSAPTPPIRPTESDWLAGWSLRDRVDVGNLIDEQAHEYDLSEGTWEGRRDLPLWHGPARWFAPVGAVAGDDGRAFVGHEQFVVRGLTPGRPALIVKRVDGNVPDQVSRVLLGGRDVGEFRSGPRVGAWRELVIEIPAEAVTAAVMTVREDFVSSPVDVNAFEFRLYQPAVP